MGVRLTTKLLSYWFYVFCLRLNTKLKSQAMLLGGELNQRLEQPTA